MGKNISAVNIKKLWHVDAKVFAEALKDAADLTGDLLKTILSTAQEVTNIHQDTWTIEEGEPSQDTYKNQLTGATYRMGAKQMGDVTFNWTIGQYDYATKEEFMGGTGTEKSWKRERGAVVKEKALIALTEDDQYCVLPKANITAREAQTDGAIGIAVVGTMMEPDNVKISPEYWFDKTEVYPEEE